MALRKTDSGSARQHGGGPLKNISANGANGFNPRAKPGSGADASPCGLETRRRAGVGYSTVLADPGMGREAASDYLRELGHYPVTTGHNTGQKTEKKD